MRISLFFVETFPEESLGASTDKAGSFPHTRLPAEAGAGGAGARLGLSRPSPPGLPSPTRAID